MIDQPDMKEEGAHVRSLREAIGLSRAEFAGQLGVSVATIRNVENGCQRLGARTLRLAEELSERDAKEREDDANARRSRGKSACSSPVVHHGGTSIMDRALMVKALAASEDEEVQNAARALSGATGCPHLEAVAIIVEEKLRRES